jgi:hypothetical protein
MKHTERSQSIHLTGMSFPSLTFIHMQHHSVTTQMLKGLFSGGWRYVVSPCLEIHWKRQLHNPQPQCNQEKQHLYYIILPYITIDYHILLYITIYYHILAISAVNLSLPTQSHIAFSEFHQSLLCSGPIPQTSTDQRPLRRPFLQPVDLINSSDRWILAVKIFLKTLDPIFFTFQTPRSEHDFVLNTIISMKKSVKVIPVKVMCGKCGRFWYEKSETYRTKRDQTTL